MRYVFGITQLNFTVAKALCKTIRPTFGVSQIILQTRKCKEPNTVRVFFVSPQIQGQVKVKGTGCSSKLSNERAGLTTGGRKHIKCYCLPPLPLKLQNAPPGFICHTANSEHYQDPPLALSSVLWR